nr:hypothetical protein [Lachnospiraceae bacterium]
MEEVHANYGILPQAEKLSADEVRALPMEQKEEFIGALADIGLLSFQPELMDAKIKVEFAPSFPLVMACTVFSVLNKLEKLDGGINMLFPHMTLELHVPLGAKKGLTLWELLIIKLYPWLSVNELSSNLAAATPAGAGSTGPGAPQKYSAAEKPAENKAKPYRGAQ